MPANEDRYAVNVESAIYRDGEYLLIERAAAEDHAPGVLSFVGGTVEATNTDDVLEAELAREINEEVAIAVADLHYVRSNAFTADDGTPCVNIVFLGRHAGGEPRIAAPAEVAAVEWHTIENALAHPAMSPWTAEFLRAADERRDVLGW